jgi:hypothetical protein
MVNSQGMSSITAVYISCYISDGVTNIQTEQNFVCDKGMAREGPNCFMSIPTPVASNGPQHKNDQFHQVKCADLHDTDTSLSFTLQLLYSWKQTLVPMKWREGRMVPRACINAVKKKKKISCPYLE